MRLVLVLLSVVACASTCYWNRQCPYQLYATKTPYDTIRGDIRDFAVPRNCKAVSLWSLGRHGNRNPEIELTDPIKYIISLKSEILASFDAGRSQLCSQDISNLRRWSWNETLDVSQSFLTAIGYEEMFNIASRIREKYPHLLQGSEEDYYLRPSKEQRTIASAIAFAHGLSDGTNLTLPIREPIVRDDVFRPYEYCDRYFQHVESSHFADVFQDYFKTTEFIDVQDAVQRRLGITTHLTQENIFTLYELCRFDRSWNMRLQSPWCAMFSNQDLVVLEYKDDLRHYYRNGYGSPVSVGLGGLALKNLYETFEYTVRGQGRKITSYLMHSSLTHTVWTALGIFKDPYQLQASFRNPNRAWRTSLMDATAVNLIAVLNSCHESGVHTHRVQFFINEKQTEICPLEGCTWKQFQDKFQRFTSANLDFCSLDYKASEAQNNSDIATVGPFVVTVG